MSTDIQNLNKLRELRLNAMATAYELQQEQAKLQHLAFDDRFGLLLESEVSTRNSRKLNRLVKSAGFPEVAAFEDYDARASRGLDKALMVVVQGEPPVAGTRWRVSPMPGRLHVFDQSGLRMEAAAAASKVNVTELF